MKKMQCFNYALSKIIENYIQPDFVHVLADGKSLKRVIKSLALELEEKGYDWLFDLKVQNENCKKIKMSLFEQIELQNLHFLESKLQAFRTILSKGFPTEKKKDEEYKYTIWRKL